MKRVGFTLVELLVVIAIISILAAIIFPAAMRAKDAAYRSSDMSHLNELRSALQLYRVDQGGYPPALFGYVQPYTGSPTPAPQVVGYLYPKRVTAVSTFQPAYDRANNTDVVGGATAGCGTPDSTCVYWPSSVASAGTSCAGQAFDYRTPFLANMNQAISATNPVPTFYAADGYDVAPVKEPDGTTRYEIHYTLFWTGYGLGVTLGSTACTSNGVAGGPPGSAGDNPRQLGYSNPPDSTVITWDTFFRDYGSDNLPASGEKRDVVLFLGGNAKMYDSRTVAQNAWNVSQ